MWAGDRRWEKAGKACKKRKKVTKTQESGASGRVEATERHRKDKEGRSLQTNQGDKHVRGGEITERECEGPKGGGG